MKPLHATFVTVLCLLTLLAVGGPAEARINELSWIHFRCDYETGSDGGTRCQSPDICEFDRGWCM